MRKPVGAEGKARVQTSSPCSPSATGRQSSPNTWVAIPKPAHCSSPRRTGASGWPSAKHERMSVPPVIEAKATSLLNDSYTQSNDSGLSTEPVDSTDRIAGKSPSSAGRKPSLLIESMNLAEVPKCVIASSSARRKSRPGSSSPVGLPSKRTRVQSEASAVTSQFHLSQQIIN